MFGLYVSYPKTYLALNFGSTAAQARHLISGGRTLFSRKQYRNSDVLSPKKTTCALKGKVYQLVYLK